MNERCAKILRYLHLDTPGQRHDVYTAPKARPNVETKMSKCRCQARAFHLVIHFSCIVASTGSARLLRLTIPNATHTMPSNFRDLTHAFL